MDTALFSSTVLLVAGLGLLLHHGAIARIFWAQIPFRDAGVFSENEDDLVWERIVVVAGLALAVTGFLKLFGLS